MEPTNGPRRFALLDAITLLAATAIGLALWRSSLERMWIEANLHWPPDLHWFWRNGTSIVALLIPWSLALLALSFRQPRPRRLAARPSAIVGFVVSAALALTAIFVLIAVCVKDGFILVLIAVCGGDGLPAQRYDGVRQSLNLVVPREVALSLASVWLLGDLRRGDRKRRDWLDVMGWVLGGCWVVLGLLCQALYFLIWL